MSGTWPAVPVAVAVAVGLAPALTGCGDSVEFPVVNGVIEAEVDTSDRAELAAASPTGTATSGPRCPWRRGGRRS